MNHILLSNVISTKYGFKPLTTTFRSVMKTKRQCHISCYTVRTSFSVARFQLSLNEVILSILLSEYISYKRNRICTNSLLIPPMFVFLSFFKLSSRQIYIVLSSLLFLSPSFALQPLHSYLTSFQIYSFYANSSFLEKFSIFFRVMTQNYICT